MQISEIRLNEYQALGQITVAVYSQLEGFPSQQEQPDYYLMLAHIGRLNEQVATRVFVARSDSGEIMGGVVYFSDMAMYGSGGSATSVKNASGIRLLSVDPKFRRRGVGRELTLHCINRALEDKNSQVILHTTQSMEVAWRLYEKLGFKRSGDLDFLQGELPVFGFRMQLNRAQPLRTVLDRMS